MTHPDLDTTVIESLVEGFARRIRQLKSPATKEAEVRLEFIDPFFEALGWDVRNVKQRPAWEKPVLVEASLEVAWEGRLATRNPDYLFRTGGFPRFVVEAKKPAEDLRNNADFIFQAKRYAWTAQIPFAILTDFEDFLLFDCTLKPVLTDPHRGWVRDFTFSYGQYVAQWATLRDVFSADAVASGSLEALLARIKRLSPKTRVRGVDRLLFDLKGTEPVDKSFLADLEAWRERLAKDIYSRNKKHFPHVQSLEGAARLTEAADRVLDRLIFARIAEDRGLLRKSTLRDLLDRCRDEGGDVYRALCAEFRDLDRFFNGYLFKPHFTEELDIAAEVLDDLISNLYFPHSPYRFDVFGDEVLGSIYERFLGKTLRVEHGRVVAQLKPELRHAGGVFYTPRFIVDAIVERVLSPLTVGKTPKQLSTLKVLDPACGSGSFLLGAFRFLVRAHEEYYRQHPADHDEAVRLGHLALVDGEPMLTLGARLSLLTQNLFGVDIDPQAVEVTIMSLYLKALEGQIVKEGRRAKPILPALDHNVRCGNSLITQEIFAQALLFDDDARYRINAFDWDSPTFGFRDIVDEGGFDAVIGNPPYIRVQEMQHWAPDETEYLKGAYKSASNGNFDIYVVFIERGMQLLKRGGLLGFICPHKFFQANYGLQIRGLISTAHWLREIVDFGTEQVFQQSVEQAVNANGRKRRAKKKKITTYTCLLILEKSNRESARYRRIGKLVDGEQQLSPTALLSGDVEFSVPEPAGANPWNFAAPDKAVQLARWRQGSTTLAKQARLFQGIKTGRDSVFALTFLGEEKGVATLLSEATGRNHEIEVGILRPLVKGPHMRPFAVQPTNLRLLFPYKRSGDRIRLISEPELRSIYPLAFDYLAGC